MVKPSPISAISRSDRAPSFQPTHSGLGAKVTSEVAVRRLAVYRRRLGRARRARRRPRRASRREAQRRKGVGRDGTVADVANAAVFFASDLSAYISCNVLPVDGGLSSYTLSTSDADIAAAANASIEQ